MTDLTPSNHLGAANGRFAAIERELTAIIEARPNVLPPDTIDALRKAIENLEAAREGIKRYKHTF